MVAVGESVVTDARRIEECGQRDRRVAAPRSLDIFLARGVTVQREHVACKRRRMASASCSKHQERMTSKQHFSSSLLEQCDAREGRSLFKARHDDVRKCTSVMNMCKHIPSSNRCQYAVINILKHTAYQYHPRNTYRPYTSRVHGTLLLFPNTSRRLSFIRPFISLTGQHVALGGRIVAASRHRRCGPASAASSHSSSISYAIACIFSSSSKRRDVEVRRDSVRQQ